MQIFSKKNVEKNRSKKNVVVLEFPGFVPLKNAIQERQGCLTFKNLGIIQ
jgi:hypothetical protein